MSNIKKRRYKPRLYVSVTILAGGIMAAMLRDSVAIVVVRTRPRAIPLAMKT